MAHPGGRPSKYTKELADRICEELAMGKSLRTVCKADDVPSMQTVFSWLRTNKEFLEQYTRAKEESADAYVEEMQDLADDVPLDKDAINKARLQIDTRKWVSSKLKPKKYGDKMDVTTDGKPITVMFDNAFTPKTEGNSE